MWGVAFVLYRGHKEMKPIKLDYLKKGASRIWLAMRLGMKRHGRNDASNWGCVTRSAPERVSVAPYEGARLHPEVVGCRA